MNKPKSLRQCADNKLSGHGRSNAELFEMIVAADLAHDRKKWSRLNENRKSIANDHQRRRDAETREQQHHDGHRDRGDKTGE